MKDEEEVKSLLRQQKNKWKKDTKAIKQGTATLQDVAVSEPKPKQMKVNLSLAKPEETKVSKADELADQEDAAPSTPIKNKRQ